MCRRSSRWLSGLLVAVAACGGGGNPTPPGDGGNSGCGPGQEKFLDVCVNSPSLAAQRTSCGDVTEFCDPTAQKTPALACLTAGPKQRPPTPATVTLTGFVHPFSSGKSNSEVTIQVFRAADLLANPDLAQATPVVAPVAVTFDPATATDPRQFRACDSDKKIGCIPVSPSACTAPVCNDGLSGRPDEGKYCRLVNGAGVCSEVNKRLRWEPRFAIPGLPTNTALVLRATGKNAQPDQVWAVLVQWNVLLATDDKACGGDDQATDCLDTSVAPPRYQLNVNVLSQSDYTNIPVTAGLAGGISNGLGAVAGEVHDCDNIRITNAQVGVSPSGDRFTYFNGNPYNTLPDSARAGTGTDVLGLYASLNVPTGPVVVEAVGLVGGTKVLLGKASARVFANSVSVVNVNGGKQLP